MRVGVPQILHHRESRPACHPLLPHRQTHLENERLGGAHVPCGAEEQPTHRVHGFQRALQAKKTTAAAAAAVKATRPLWRPEAAPLTWTLVPTAVLSTPP